MSHSAIEYLRHILDEAEYLIEYSRGLSREQFMKDPTLQRAFVRSLEVIGEATKRIPEEFRTRYSHVAWKSMAGMRDKLIHDYMGVDYDIVWDVVINKVPLLYRDIRAIIDSEATNE